MCQMASPGTCIMLRLEVEHELGKFPLTPRVQYQLLPEVHWKVVTITGGGTTPTRVVHGSILCDTIQPNPSAD